MFRDFDADKAARDLIETGALRALILRGGLPVRGPAARVKIEQDKLDRQHRYLEQQIQAKSDHYLFYHLTEDQILNGLGPFRSGPVVTVCLARITKMGCCPTFFARGVSICYSKDTPNKKIGRIYAMRALLRALKDGEVEIEPADPKVRQIAEALVKTGLVERYSHLNKAGDEVVSFTVGTSDIDLPAESDEAKRFRALVDAKTASESKEPKITWKQIKWYRDHTEQCPRCQARGLNRVFKHHAPGCVFMDTSCPQCGLKWVDHYKLLGPDRFTSSKLSKEEQDVPKA